MRKMGAILSLILNLINIIRKISRTSKHTSIINRFKIKSRVKPLIINSFKEIVSRLPVFPANYHKKLILTGHSPNYVLQGKTSDFPVNRG